MQRVEHVICKGPLKCRGPISNLETRDRLYHDSGSAPRVIGQLIGCPKGPRVKNQKYFGATYSNAEDRVDLDPPMIGAIIEYFDARYDDE